MNSNRLRRFSSALALGSLVQFTLGPVLPARAQSASRPMVTGLPASADSQIAQYFRDPTGPNGLGLTDLTLKQLVQRKIRHVFVIFNENESFDHEYGSFPGVNGIYSDGAAPRSPANTPGYSQAYKDAAGGSHTVTPFLLGPAQNANVIDSVDHSHTGLATKINVQGGVPQMNMFSADEYTGKAGTGTAVTAASSGKGMQYATFVMSHIDCNTIPFFWMYANRFAIFDNIFATEDTPSTPNAVAMIAGQSGETQWVKHGSAGTTQAISGTINGTTYSGQGTTQGPPLVNDPNPYWGSEFDATTRFRAPTSPAEFYGVSIATTVPPTYNIASNLTFANVLLTLGGANIRNLLSGDLNPATNEADIQNDIPVIAASSNPGKVWRWYQNGYSLEPTDTNGVASHANYVAHHNGPQYFGYIANNLTEAPNLKGEGDFFTDLAAGNIPEGVVYIRGGFQNIQGLKPPIQNPNFPGPLTAANIQAVQVAKAGDDDHPSYSDRMVSEAATARIINAVASNPTLWAESAIIITYDESDGFWDHVPPRILSYGPDKLPLSRGVRVPLLVVSPYAYTHVAVHAEGDHNAIIETINAIFNLPALSSLPDEASALAAGNSPAFNALSPIPGFQQLYLGPRDTNSPITDSLLAAFDPNRLLGLSPILPASYAMIPDSVVTSLPHYNGGGCRAIGVTPEDVRQGIVAPPPANLNTLAGTLPSFTPPGPVPSSTKKGKKK